MSDMKAHHVVDLQDRAYAAGYENRAQDRDQPQMTFYSHMLGWPEKYEKVGRRTFRLRQP